MPLVEQELLIYLESILVFNGIRIVHVITVIEARDICLYHDAAMQHAGLRSSFCDPTWASYHSLINPKLQGY